MSSEGSAKEGTILAHSLARSANENLKRNATCADFIVYTKTCEHKCMQKKNTKSAMLTLTTDSTQRR